MIQKTFLATIFALSLGSIAAPATAAVYVRIAPPEPRVEVVPAPRPGHAWSAGHWEWRHNRHEWVGGTWVRERRGYHYNQPAWVEHEGRWSMNRGGWRRGDNDHDGVPNGRDREPNNPRRN